jgi:hypothetical protein
MDAFPEWAVDVSLIPEDGFRALMNAVEALPLKRRTKWHGFIRDTNGVKHKVHFINGRLVFKRHSVWVTLKPLGTEHFADSVEYAAQNIKGHHERMTAAYKHGGHAAARQEHNRMVNEAATGNHRSKPHKVSIPTGPGEPVRG